MLLKAPPWPRSDGWLANDYGHAVNVSWVFQPIAVPDS